MRWLGVRGGLYLLITGQLGPVVGQLFSVGAHLLTGDGTRGEHLDCGHVVGRDVFATRGHQRNEHLAYPEVGSQLRSPTGLFA